MEHKAMARREFTEEAGQGLLEQSFDPPNPSVGDLRRHSPSCEGALRYRPNALLPVVRQSFKSVEAVEARFWRGVFSGPGTHRLATEDAELHIRDRLITEHGVINIGVHLVTRSERDGTRTILAQPRAESS